MVLRTLKVIRRTRGRGELGRRSMQQAALLMALLVVGDCRDLFAASLAFEATVASVDRPNLPLAIAPGDPISISFSFETSIAGSPYQQGGELVIRFGDTALMLRPFKISVRNDDFPGVAQPPGRIADPLNTPIDDYHPPIHDSIVIEPVLGMSAAGLLPGTVSGHPDFTVYPRIVFALPEDVLSSAALLADPAVWNAFEFREMGITLRNGSQATYVGAYIGQGRAVPEPSSSVVLVLGLTTPLLFARQRRRLGRSSAGIAIHFRDFI